MEIWNSLSLEKIRFHILFEKDNFQQYYRCYLQLPVKGTYLMINLWKNKIFCCFIQQQNHWRFSGQTKCNSWNEWLAFIGNVIKILFLLHSRRSTSVYKLRLLESLLSLLLQTCLMLTSMLLSSKIASVSL